MVSEWLQKKTQWYTLHEIQNNFLAQDILSCISSCLQQPKFATLTIDETTDVSNASQAVQYVRDLFDVHEDLSL